MYRFVLNTEERELLVGGVVLEKNRQVAQVVRQDDRVNMTQFTSLEEYQKDSSEEKSSDDIAYDEFVLYDFSGEMLLCPDVDNKDVRIKANLLNVGDVVYVIGRVIPINGEEGYFIEPKGIFSESELELYQAVYPEYFKELKESAKILLSQSVSFEPSQVLYYYRNPEEILQYFLRNGDRVCVFDYQQLADAFYNPDVSDRMKQILRRLFLRSFRHMNGINPEEYMEDIYPFLK